MRMLGIDRLSVFNMPPVDFARLAARLGCRSVGIGLAPTMTYNPHGFAPWSLRDDAALRRAFTAALAQEDVAIGIVEGFALRPGADIGDCARDLDLVAELGGRRIAAVSLDGDLARMIDGMAALAALAAARGLGVSAELGSLGPIPTIGAAMALWHGVGAANFSLLIDAMHFFRLGSTLAELAAVPPAAIGYVQLCDARWQPRFATYIEEAMYERMVPGEGELPLRGLIDLLPPAVVVSLELPQRSLAERGVDAYARLAPAVAAARALLAGAGATGAAGEGADA